MHLPLQLRTPALSTHLKGPRFHTLHRLTQNEVFAALPSPPHPNPLQASCPGFPEIMPTPGLGSLPTAPHLPEAYQPGLSEEQEGPLRTCYALCCHQQGPDHGVPERGSSLSALPALPLKETPKLQQELCRCPGFTAHNVVSEEPLSRWKSGSGVQNVL